MLKNGWKPLLLVLVGLALIGAGLRIDPSRPRCGSVELGPGHICEISGKGVPRQRTYDELSAESRRYRTWLPVGGAVVVAGGLGWLVWMEMRRRRDHEDADTGARPGGAPARPGPQDPRRPEPADLTAPAPGTARNRPAPQPQQRSVWSAPQAAAPPSTGTRAQQDAPSGGATQWVRRQPGAPVQGQPPTPPGRGVPPGPQSPASQAPAAQKPASQPSAPPAQQGWSQPSRPGVPPAPPPAPLPQAPPPAGFPPPPPQPPQPGPASQSTPPRRR